MKEYTVKRYWDSLYTRKRYEVYTGGTIIDLVNKYIPNAKGEQKCYEIGCCPCGFLSYMGVKKKYIINGIDYSDGINENLQHWLDKLPLKKGNIVKADFFKNNDIQQYDFVYSFGFIEHFKNYKKVVKMHDKYVKKGGYLMITAPNFKGKIQYFLHRFLDYENLKRHNVYSMCPEEWKEVLGTRYEILYCGYFGGFQFWVEDEPKCRFKRGIVSFMKMITEVLSDRKVKNSALYSPFCGIIARKISD